MNWTKCCCLLGIVVLAGQFPLVARAGDSLSQVRSEVRTADAPAPAKPDKKRRNDDHDHCVEVCYDDHDSDSGSASIYILAFTSPWWVPAALVGDDYTQTGYFARHPYAASEAGPNHTGYMLFDDSNSAEGYTWAGRVSGYYGTDFNDLTTIGGQILLENSSRLGLDSTADFRTQDLGGSMSDELWTGDFNVVYRFAQSERVQMRTGVGFNFLSDTIGNDFGFNFTYSGDIMLGDPLILSTELDLGYLGESSVTHFRSTLGAVWHGIELFGGYDYYEVGDADISSLISGVRIWF